MADLRRTIIILMALACVVTAIGIIHCHSNYYSYTQTWYSYRTGYTILFPILFSLTGFLLIEQLLITDGTLAPLNRLRIIYAFGAAIALIIFGIGAAIDASRYHYRERYESYYHSAIIAAVIAFIGGAIYIGEAVSRNRKSRII
ncbi:unnamed protein product [Adineta steineri]|uniref:MARVEL domain-containing protein n=1 Tax=Adineta steineri TaxID=433720 RepID=A0A815NJW2_9BILA|nr:unnamed protein product [Adineta steineri]CAF1480790.1 unnamed protein product [Adineta steineri]CAF3651007.1 unnamed protein product [Adineta steineri]CAF3807215.1 unnamed protein product [Adineta steineri]